MTSSPGVNATGTMGARKSIRKISSAYDAAGRLTSTSDPASAYTYTYDAIGRLSTTDNNTTPNLPRVILTATYDAAGHRTGLSSTVAGVANFSNTYVFDGIGRMTSAWQNGAGIAQKRADFAYNSAGQYSLITRSSTTASITEVSHSDYGYDLANRLTSLAHRKPDTSALATAYVWTYDSEGKVSTFTNAEGTITYSYDANSQVTVADYTAGADENYSYDRSGNRTIAGYTTISDNRLSSDGTYNYLYDQEGNRSRRTKISDSTYIDYTWDYRNRLTDVIYKTAAGVKTKAIKYVYDVTDRRIERQLDATGDGVYESKERYIYDGEDIVLVYDGSNALINRYLHGPDFDQPLAEESAGSVVKWYLSDEQGSIRDMGDNAGNLVAGSHVIYNSFGVVTSGTPNRYAYTGREWDSDAGMYYYRARWYDQSIGRFISQDPKGFDAGDVNLYRYVGNNSPNLQDPTGMCAVCNALGSAYRGEVIDPVASIYSISTGEQPLVDLGRGYSAPGDSHFVRGTNYGWQQADTAMKAAMASEAHYRDAGDNAIANLYGTRVSNWQGYIKNLQKQRDVAAESDNYRPRGAVLIAQGTMQGMANNAEAAINSPLDMGGAIATVTLAPARWTFSVLENSSDPQISDWAARNRWVIPDTSQRPKFVDFSGAFFTEDPRIHQASTTSAAIGQSVLFPYLLGELSAGVGARAGGSVAPRVGGGAGRPLGGVQANKAAGDAAADAIAIREGGFREGHFETVGGVRKPDVIVPGNETLTIESKVGKTSLTPRVRQELARDWWLHRQGQVDRVRWEFTPNESGQVGPTSPLAEKLNKLGFDVKINK